MEFDGTLMQCDGDTGGFPYRSCTCTYDPLNCDSNGVSAGASGSAIAVSESSTGASGSSATCGSSSSSTSPDTAASGSNCSNSSDIQVLQYASAIQAYSYVFYSSIPLNQTFFSNAPNSSNANYAINFQGMEQQNRLGALLLEDFGSNFEGFQAPKCRWKVVSPSNGTAFLEDALYIETTVTGALLGLTGYTLTAEIAEIINWLAVQHGAHAAYITSFTEAIVFPTSRNLSSLPPILPPNYVLGTRDETFMLGQLLGGCVTAPKGPCS
ncbi:uncharacterized protein N7503_008350 [Penicillium pulvis]|uniref:uncharacterized protein n=1 Tax=Penicillium pulvis TaxID=1562058 RepID=UPI002547A94B|nr:uncharacterized protein N7503_008350 [Penicillium pulvis]KAJ5792372.1 hypothetical protein N7503_008350 [Penicillium pulvis]